MKKIMLKTDWATKHPVSPFWSFEISAEDLAKQLSVEEFGKFFNAYLLRKTKECCKYSVISHGIGLSGEVEEIKVHCKMNPENDYTEPSDLTWRGRIETIWRIITKKPPERFFTDWEKVGLKENKIEHNKECPSLQNQPVCTCEKLRRYS